MTIRVGWSVDVQVGLLWRSRRTNSEMGNVLVFAWSLDEVEILSLVCACIDDTILARRRMIGEDMDLGEGFGSVPLLPVLAVIVVLHARSTRDSNEEFSNSPHRQHPRHRKSRHRPEGFASMEEAGCSTPCLAPHHS